MSRSVRALMRLSPLVVVLAVLMPMPAAYAGEQVQGSGSTWSSIAISQWIADVKGQGLSVNYNANGSSAGRQLYIQNQYDFGVSEIPFQPASRDRDGNVVYDEIQAARVRPYAYMPIVAGGTSFMYHLDVAGHRVDDLRLSGRTIAKIFTGKITNWNDPAIAADDGRHFPSLGITPVVRSDGSGTSAQFTAYMHDMFPDIWPGPMTSLYPYNLGNSKFQAGSDGVAGYVAAPYNNGSITYVEYGYAKERNRWPVVSVLNQAGYFKQPSAQNVAIALTRAHINADRTQVLGDVYRNPDPNAYPVSSYSYMIVPTSTAGRMTTGKGQTLGRFILYFLCTGQQKADLLGYSPLPANLVQFAFDAEKLIPGAPPPPPISQCANPNITGAFAHAPPPPASEKFGAPPPALPGGPGPAGSSGPSNGVTQSQFNNGSNSNSSRNSGHTTTTTAKGSRKAAAGKGNSGTSGDGSATSGANEQNVASAPISIAHGTDGGVTNGVYVLVALVILAAVFLPPALAVALRRRN